MKHIKKTIMCICFISLLLVLLWTIGAYINAKYIKKEANSRTLMRKDIELSNQELYVHGEMYPGMTFYQGYEYAVIDDSVYLTIYWTMMAQDESDDCQFDICIIDNFECVTKVYLRHENVDELIYERD